MRAGSGGKYLLAFSVLSCGGLIDKGERRSDSATSNGGHENVSPSVDGERDEVKSPSEDPQNGSIGRTSRKTEFTPKQVKTCLQIGAIEARYWEEYREIQNRPQVFWEPSEMEAPPPEPDWPETPCYRCWTSCRDSPLESQCGHISACVERHCLCEDCDAARLDGQSMCDCVELCMPNGQSACRGYWDDVMSCRADACFSNCE